MEIRICARCRRMNRVERARCSDCGANMEGAPRAHYEPPPEPPFQPPCPRCGVRMRSGSAGMEYGFPKALFRGHVLPDLVFRPSDAEETVRFSYGLRYLAHFCARCGGLWLDQDPPAGT